MKYELSHDTIARQIFEKASTEARTRRKVERYISERYAAYQERGARLTQDDVDFVTPYLAQVNISAEESAFIAFARKQLLTKRRNIRLLVIAIFSVLIGLTAWAVINGEQAVANAARSLENEKRALASESDATAKAAALEIKETELQESLEEAQLARDTSEIRRIAAEMAQIRADRNAAEANTQRKSAEQRLREAEALVLIAKASALPREKMATALRIAQAAYEYTAEPLSAVSRGMATIFYKQLAYDDKPNSPLFSQKIKTTSIYERRIIKSDVKQTYSSKDQQFILSHMADGAVIVKDVDNNIVFESTGDSIVYASAQFLGKQNTVVLLTEEGVCKIWSIDQKKELAVPPLLRNKMSLLKVSPDGEKWVTTLNDGSTQIRDKEGNIKYQIAIDRDVFSGIVFSSNSRYFSVGGSVWNVNGQLYGSYKMLDYSIRGFSPDGELLVMTKTKTGYSGLVNNQDRVRVESLAGNWATEFIVADFISYAHFTEKGDELLVEGRNKYEEPGQYYLYTYPIKGLLMESSNIEGLNQQNWFSPDGQFVISQAHFKPPFLQSFNGNFIADWETCDIRVQAAEFSSSSSSVLLLGKQKGVYHWDIENLEEESIIDSPEEYIRDLIYSPKGDCFLVDTGESDWSLYGVTGQKMAHFASSLPFREAIFSPDGNFIATCSSDNEIKLWESNGVFVKNLNSRDEKMESFVFSPDSHDLATTWSDGTIEVLSLETGETTFIGQTVRPAMPIFSPDGKTILTFDANWQVKLWNRKGQLLADLSSYKFDDVVFSPDSKQFAGSYGGTIRIFNIDGQMLAEYSHHSNTIYHLAFSGDGNYITSASMDDTAKIWPTPQRIYDYLKNEAAIPQLTPEQRKLYGID